MKKQFLSMVLAAIMVISCTACAENGKEKSVKQSAVTTAEITEGETEEKEIPKITYWCQIPSDVYSNFQSLGDTKFGKGLMERTGTEIEFLHPPASQANEQFSLLLADGNLPDIMEYNWLTYPGGPEKAIKDGAIIPLNDVFEKYCPNITKYLAEHPDVDKMVRTDDGHYYAFPFIRGDDTLINTIGLSVRSDWLEELGLELPTTVDEWHTVLTAFKEKKGADAPFAFSFATQDYVDYNPFIFAHNASSGFYVHDDGTIHFGAVEPEYKDYLTTFAQWYKEGLIDPDIATLAFDQVSAKITNGRTGATISHAGSGLGVWLSTMKDIEPEFMLWPTPVPTLNKGDYPEFGWVDSLYAKKGSAAITTSCKNVEAAAKMLDYAYSEEGYLYYNFGIEGESYEMIDGKPVYTDAVMNNTKGWSLAQALCEYIRGNYFGPFVQSPDYLGQYYVYDCQKASREVWGAHNGSKHVLPPITPTEEESREFSSIINEIKTYRDEMTLKFIFGTESLDNFDTYVENIYKMGLDRALEIQNNALVRYEAR